MSIDCVKKAKHQEQIFKKLMQKHYQELSSVAGKLKTIELKVNPTETSFFDRSHDYDLDVELYASDKKTEKLTQERLNEFSREARFQKMCWDLHLMVSKLHLES